MSRTWGARFQSRDGGSPRPARFAARGRPPTTTRPVRRWARSPPVPAGGPAAAPACRRRATNAAKAGASINPSASCGNKSRAGTRGRGTAAGGVTPDAPSAATAAYGVEQHVAGARQRRGVCARTNPRCRSAAQRPTRRRSTPRRGWAESPGCRSGSPARARPAGVGAEREVGQPGRDRRRRSRRRSARHARRRAPVQRRAVVVVLAGQAQGQLVGDGQADQRRARVEQAAPRRAPCASPARASPTRSGCRNTR